MIRKKTNKTPVIDLNGPDGNAFALMGYAKKWGKDLGYSPSDIELMISDMMSSDYEHLIKVFESYFGDYVILER